jgi:hypothetical protein
MSPLIIERIDLENPRFKKSFTKLPPTVAREAHLAIGLLVLADIMNPPARLHMHALANKMVPSRLDPMKKVKVYTIHLSSNDSHKASFTFEDRTAFMRHCGTHDEIDKNP